MSRRDELLEQARTLGLKPARRATIPQLEHMIAAAGPRDLDPETRAELLAYITEHPSCSVREACEHVRIRRADVRELKRTDGDFAEDYEEARGYGHDRIRGAIVERAIDGVEVPIVSDKGEIVGYRTEYSDRLLEFLARMNLPEAKELLRARIGVQIGGPNDGPIPVEVNGGRVTSLGDVIALARELGVGLGAGLADGARGTVDAGPPRGALPPAADVLPDPPDG